MTVEEVERGYNNRAAVPEHPYWLAEFTARSQRAIEALQPMLDVRYGTGPKETLDLYRPNTPARGTLVFIHGGWWRALDKSDHGFVAPAFVAAGYAVALVNYDLCPEVPIATIVEQCRRALAFLAREGKALGAPAPRVVGGHSAGGHLTAMMYATEWQALGIDGSPFVGGVSLSGVHDLEPLVLFSLNVDFRLDEATARRLSPIHHRPLGDAPLLCAVGAEETSEFRRQTRLLWDAWPANRPAAMPGPLEVPSRHHYNVVLDYCEPGSALTQATLALFRGR